MARSLRDFFGTNQLEFSSTTSSPSLVPALTRSYSSFSQAVDEILDARVWSGIHFRIADVHGAKIGRQKSPPTGRSTTSTRQSRERGRNTTAAMSNTTTKRTGRTTSTTTDV